ncbi:T9SS type A sorting domain-containing protein [Flavobacterium sp.]|uniref:T9SS type A sorting domain-containing protein n=1 Tax=Flavobacterium sp. TaxID=239 RepID=UPI0035295498
MKKLYFKLVILLAATCSIYAQDFEWAIPFQGLYNSESTDIAVDNSGNVYTTGWFEVSADFDPSASTYALNSSANRTAFISKNDANGILLWAVKIGDSGYNQGNSVFIDSNSNVYVTGYYQNTADFNPSDTENFNLTAVGVYDVFVIKLDSNGNFIWAKSFGGTSVDMGLDIVASSNGVYISGRYQGTIDLDPGANTLNITSNGSIDAFLVKLDTNGNFLWGHSFGSTGNERAESVGLDTLENVVVLFYYNGTVDFDPSAATNSLTSSGGSDIAVVKFDYNGNFIWAKSMGGNGTEEPSKLVIDSNNNIITTGYFSDTADFDPSTAAVYLNATGSFSVFVSKLDSDGNYVWAKAITSNTNCDAKGIAVDSNNNILVNGLFSGTTDFDPDVSVNFNVNSNGSNDIFVTKLTSNGNFIWNITVGGTGNDLARGVIVDKTNDAVYTTGAFLDIVDFDPSGATFNLTSAGLKDVFILKLSTETMYNSDFTSENIKAYPNPVTNKLLINSKEDITKIIIYDFTGKQIYSKEVMFINSDIVDFSNFQSGIYIVEIYNELKSIKMKIIKE